AGYAVLPHAVPTRRSSGLWDAGPNGTLTGHDVLKGMKVASRLCPGVVLLSLGFSGDYFFYERYLLHEGIDIAVSRGCLVVASARSEEHTSELQTPGHIVCR